MSFFLLFILNTTMGRATDLVTLYRERNFDQIIGLLKDLPDAQQNAESLYYLALSYTQTRQYTQAKETLARLMVIDADFYRHRLQHDLDFSDLWRQEDLAAWLASYTKGEVLAQYSAKGHEIVRTDSGVFLYRNGVKQVLLNTPPLQGAGFIDDQIIYLFHSDKRKNHLLHIYDAGSQRTLSTLTLKHAITGINFKKTGMSHLMQSAQGHVLYQDKTWKPIGDFAEGVYMEN